MQYLPKAFPEEANLTIMKINLGVRLGFNKYTHKKIGPRVTFTDLMKKSADLTELNRLQLAEKINEEMKLYFECVDKVLERISNYSAGAFMKCDNLLRPLVDRAFAKGTIASNKAHEHRAVIVNEYRLIKENFRQKLLKSLELSNLANTDSEVNKYFVRLQCVQFNPTLFGIVHENYALKTRKDYMIGRLPKRTYFWERIALYNRMAKIVTKLHYFKMAHGKLRTEDFVQFNNEDDERESALGSGVKLIVFPTNKSDFLDYFAPTPQNIYIDPTIIEQVTDRTLRYSVLINFGIDEQKLDDTKSYEDFLKSLFTYKSNISDSELQMADIYSLGVIFLSMEFISITNLIPEYDNLDELLAAFEATASQESQEKYPGHEEELMGFVQLIKKMVSSAREDRPSAKDVAKELARLHASAVKVTGDSNISRKNVAQTLGMTLANPYQTSSISRSQTISQKTSQVNKEKTMSKLATIPQKTNRSITNQSLRNDQGVGGTQRVDKTASIVHQSKNDYTRIRENPTQSKSILEQTQNKLGASRSIRQPTQTVNDVGVSKSLTKETVNKSQVKSLERSKLEKSQQNLKKSLSSNSSHVSKQSSILKSNHKDDIKASIMTGSKSNKESTKHQNERTASILQSKTQHNEAIEAQDEEQEPADEKEDPEYEPDFEDPEEERPVQASIRSKREATIQMSQQRNNNQSIHGSQVLNKSQGLAQNGSMAKSTKKSILQQSINTSQHKPSSSIAKSKDQSELKRSLQNSVNKTARSIRESEVTKSHKISASRKNSTDSFFSNLI
jgi:hypothetical protein